MAADLQAPLSFYMKGLENEGTDVNEVKKIRELREKLDKMRAYLCSRYKTLSNNVLLITPYTVTPL